MTRRFFIALALAAAAASAPAHARGTLAASGAAALTELLQGAAARGEPPGLVALVVNRDGVLYHEAFGRLNVAAGTAMPRDAVFRIHSMTKPLTSLAAMMLVDEGKLDLGDPVSRHVPALADVRVVDGRDGGATRAPRRRLTVRHLLSHTSGIGYGFSDPLLLELATKTGKSEWELPLLHDPGERWTYGAGTKVVGDIVEKISGQPLDLFLEARIFMPLGMTDTGFRVPSGKHARVATRHQRTGTALVEEPNAATEQSAVRGDGGLYSTAADYGAFVRLILNDGRWNGTQLVSGRAIRTMRRNLIGDLEVEQQPAADPVRTRPFPLGAGRDKFSAAFQIAGSSREPHRRAKGSLSWGGLRNTHFWIDPENQVGAVLMMQVLPFYDQAAIDLLVAFERRLYEHLE